MALIKHHQTTSDQSDPKKENKNTRTPKNIIKASGTDITASTAQARTESTNGIIKGLSTTSQDTIVIEKVKNIDSLKKEISRPARLIAQPAKTTRSLSEIPSNPLMIQTPLHPTANQSPTTKSTQTEPPKPEYSPPSSQSTNTPMMPILDEKTIEKALEKETQKLKQKADEAIAQYKKDQLSKMDAEIAEYKKQKFAKLDQEKQAILNQSIEEGKKIAEKKAEQSLAEQSTQILETINEAVAEKNKLLKKSRGEILRLAIKVAEQILKSEISLNQAVCVNIVAEAISRITDKDKVIIKVNRQDADFVKMNKDRFLNLMGDIKNLSILEDSRVDQGGCIIETDLGYIDATIATKLASIEKALFKTFEEELMEEKNK